MNILLLGSGGREHALAWKLSQSPLCGQLYIAPGNAGTALCGTNVYMSVGDFKGIGDFCIENKIDLVLPGSEEPLVSGIYDYFASEPLLKDIPVIGPSKAAAQLEGSKAFAKAFMERQGIPTAAYREFGADNYEEGIAYLQQHELPVVLKADGLAAGKGVLICTDREEALQEFEAMIRLAKFGEAGKKVVVEQFLTGIELSVFVMTDGVSYKLLPEAKDYKRIGEGDTGLNTGGMGAVSPVPFASGDFMDKVEKRIIRPTVEGLRKESLDYRGFIFFGLINIGGDPYVIEYNCRMGDPETEVVMPRLKSDLVQLLVAVARQQLAGETLEFDERAGATVILVSGGYPGDYEKGKEITGLAEVEGSLVFHAGARQDEERLLTNGGRVMAITTLADDLKSAVDHSTGEAAKIVFEGKYFRTDIGWEFRS